MRTEVRVFFELTYLYLIPPLKGRAAFLTGAPALRDPLPTQQIVYRYIMDQQDFLLPAPSSSLSRTYDLEARKQSRKDSSNTSESQFLQDDVTVVYFKLTIIRTPESLRLFAISQH